MPQPNPERKFLTQQFSHNAGSAIRYLDRAVEDLDILNGHVANESAEKGPSLSEAQLEELERLSNGLSLSESADVTDLTESATSTTRTEIRRELGARTLPQAVYISIERGLLPVEVKPEEAIKATLRPKTLEILRLVGKGMLSEEIATEVGLGGRTSLDHHMRTIKGTLGAKNRSHAIRRAFEESLLKFPSTPTEEAMRYLSDGRESIERAIALFGGLSTPQQ